MKKRFSRILLSFLLSVVLLFAAACEPEPEPEPIDGDDDGIWGPLYAPDFGQKYAWSAGAGEDKVLLGGADGIVENIFGITVAVALFGKEFQRAAAQA